MKDLIRKILKESEDDLEWAQDIVDKLKNPIILGRYEKYIIELCSSNIIKPDKIRYKFNELYGDIKIDTAIINRHINIFDNENIDKCVNNGEGFILYIQPKGNTIYTGWDLCNALGGESIESRILTLEEFLFAIIES